jgi:DNA-binding MarR family transcriptional regulator
VSLRDGMRLEQLMPRALAVLFHSEGADPLRHHTVGQIRLMRALAEGSKTASDLGNLLELSPSSLTQMASRMIAAGLISKVTDEGDRRVRKLSLTQSGKELMDNRRTNRARAAAKLLSQLEPEKVRMLIALLEDICDAAADHVAREAV